MNQFFNSLWHTWLGKPYRLAKTNDSGQGPTVILLHGIGSSGKVWRHIFKHLPDHRLLSYDLLGFGASPKPTSIGYTVDDHAKSVLYTIDRMSIKKPMIIVGHSMGCLVAVRVARLRPDLVKHLVLYEMPLYEGLPNKRRYQARVNLYFRFYEWVARQNPDFLTAKRNFRRTIATKVVGADLTSATWRPFILSLKNTIMKQGVAKDLPKLRMPADIIYGTRDMVVIRGKVKQTLGLNDNQITIHTLKEGHSLSESACVFIASRVQASIA